MNYKKNDYKIRVNLHTMRYRFITLMAIQNSDVPVCKTCKYYSPYQYYKFDSVMSDCTAVGKMNIVTGNIEYSSASKCRMSECGVQGKLYEPEPDVNKEIKHNFMYNLPFNLNLLSLFIALAGFVYNIIH